VNKYKKNRFILSNQALVDIYAAPSIGSRTFDSVCFEVLKKGS